MPRVELKQTKGNSAPHKKATKLETARALGKSSVSSSKTKKEKLANPHEAKKELERLFALSTTGEDSNEGSGDGSGEGSGSDECGENGNEEDTRKDKRRDRSQTAGDDDEDIEMECKGERRDIKRKSQGGVKSTRVPAKKKKEPCPVRQLRALDVKDSLKIRLANNTEAIYQVTRILARNITEHCNPHRLLIDGLVVAGLGGGGGKPSELKNMRRRLRKVTIGSIVDVHLLMRLALNAQGTWVDGANWDDAVFTSSIFDAAFESPTWVEELENWWTRRVFGRGQEDTEEFHLKRKSTALALFKEQSEPSILRRSQGGLRREIEDACKTGTTKERSGAKREHETPTKNSNVRATDEDLGDNASSTSSINTREEDSSSMNGDSAIGNLTIAGPAKRDVGSDVRESGEPPAKRARP